jgi:hypothetical protein
LAFHRITPLVSTSSLLGSRAGQAIMAGMATPTTTPLPDRDKLTSLDEFIVGWDTTEGWPTTAPITIDERNLISSALWNEPDITWLRVLGTVLNPSSEKNYREVTVTSHFNVFPQDFERMFSYWMRSRHLAEHGMALLQTYFAGRSSSFYPALTGIVPFAETVMKREGFTKGFSADYKAFFKKYDGTWVGTRTASTFVEMLYEQEPKGGLDNRERYNRHKLAHGIAPGAVTALDLLSGCLILDMVVSTVETGGQLFTRVLTS